MESTARSRPQQNSFKSLTRKSRRYGCRKAVVVLDGDLLRSKKAASCCDIKFQDSAQKNRQEHQPKARPLEVLTYPRGGWGGVEWRVLPGVHTIRTKTQHQTTTHAVERSHDAVVVCFLLGALSGRNLVFYRRRDLRGHRTGKRRKIGKKYTHTHAHRTHEKKKKKTHGGGGRKIEGEGTETERRGKISKTKTGATVLLRHFECVGGVVRLRNISADFGAGRKWKKESTQRTKTRT